MAGPRHLWVLVPAAGDSRRFKENGYPTPKPFLRVAHRELNGGWPRTMLSHVGSSLGRTDLPRLTALPPALADSVGPLVVEDEARTHVVGIGKTRGQSDTLRQMIRWLPTRALEETAVLILNCDVVFKDPAQLSWLVAQVHAGFVAAMLVVKSSSEAMSYAEPYPCPQKFVEKKVIGENAMAGAWAFASAARLLTALDWSCCQGPREPYLSQAIGRVVGPKISLRVEPGDFLDFGTPKAVVEAGAKIVD